MIKIKTAKIPYNSQIVIPRIYVDDNNILPGDSLDIFRTSIYGSDALVILPSKDSNMNYKNLVNINQKQAQNQKILD